MGWYCNTHNRRVFPKLQVGCPECQKELIDTGVRFKLEDDDLCSECGSHLNEGARCIKDPTHDVIGHIAD
jgi:hypothetical protein